MIHGFHNHTAQQLALVACLRPHSVDLGHLNSFPPLDRELLICLRDNQGYLLNSCETPQSNNVDENHAIGVIAALCL